MDEVKRLQLQIVLLESSEDGKNISLESDLPQNSRFFLGQALLPAKPVSENFSPMELTPEKSGWQIKSSHPETSLARATASFAADVYLQFCFWTIFTQMGLQLFYFSVWDLALSGSEAALFSTISPYLLAIPAVSRFVTSRRGSSILSGLSLLIGLSAYKYARPSRRLFGCIISNIFLWLDLAGRLDRLKGGKAASIEGSYMILGLLFFLVVKLMNHSVAPLWCIVDEHSGGWNKTGMFLALVAWVEKMTRPVQNEPHAPAVEKDLKDKTPNRPTLTGWRKWSVALGFASLLFMVQTFVTDLGTMIAWNWSGYPVNGPRLLWQAGFVLLAASGGLVLRWMQDRSPLKEAHPYTFQSLGTGLASCYLLAFPHQSFGLVGLGYYKDWLGFMAGCVLMGSLTYLFPPMLQDISKYSQHGRLLGHALLIKVFIDVVSVLTVAYAFVPGGQYVREQMPALVFLMFAIVFHAATVLSNIHKVSKRSANELGSTISRARHMVKLGVMLLVGLVVVTEVYIRVQRQVDIKPYSSDPAVWSGGIWTVHFGVDLEGRDSQQRMLDIVRDAELDVFGVLESDLHRFVYGNRDLTRKISEELGYYVDLGPGPNKHTWGVALFSKFPILETKHHLLPSPHGELAPGIQAKLLINGLEINVFVSHNGQEQDPLDRQLQTERIAEISRSLAPEPFGFFGYVVTHVGAHRPAPYEILMVDGKLWDVEISDDDRWCEYVAFRNLWRIGYARISHGDITDTEIQVGKFYTADQVNPVHYVSNEELYHHAPEDALPEPWHFPQLLRGDGVR